MLQNIFKNMGDVTKNLLIINVIMFLVVQFLINRGIDAYNLLGVHYPSALNFRPFQIVTSFFVHFGFHHLLLNMLGLLFLGSNLERLWGSKKFLIFYLCTAIGATVFTWIIDGLMFYVEYDVILPVFLDGPGAGASGAIFGLVAAYGLLLPNTEFHLYFLIPVKAKWIAIISAVYALYGGLNPVVNPVDNSVTGHFTHLGGMVVAFIIIQIWKRSKTEFY